MAALVCWAKSEASAAAQGPLSLEAIPPAKCRRRCSALGRLAAPSVSGTRRSDLVVTWMMPLRSNRRSWSRKRRRQFPGLTEGGGSRELVLRPLPDRVAIISIRTGRRRCLVDSPRSAGRSNNSASGTCRLLMNVQLALCRQMCQCCRMPPEEPKAGLGLPPSKPPTPSLVKRSIISTQRPLLANGTEGLRLRRRGAAGTGSSASRDSACVATSPPSSGNASPRRSGRRCVSSSGTRSVTSCRTVGWRCWGDAPPRRLRPARQDHRCRALATEPL